MRKIIYPFLALLCVAGYLWYESQITADTLTETPASQQSTNSPANTDPVVTWMTVADYLPSSKDAVINHHTYSLSYNEDHEQANWTAHVLKSRDITNREYERPYFELDLKVTTGAAHWKNYKKSGYDRGHLVPAGDRKATKESYTETFLTSNISPQKHEFNAGIWNDLEQQVRQYALNHGDLYVVTGPILKDGLNTIGTEKVSVPEAFYKIAFLKNEDGGKIIAWLIPTNAGSNDLTKYNVSVDHLEKITGIDFFSQLEDGIEEQLEGQLVSSF